MYRLWVMFLKRNKFESPVNDHIPLPLPRRCCVMWQTFVTLNCWVFPMMRMGKVVHKDSSKPSLFITWLFIRCVIIAIFITFGNKNKMSSLDTDNQLLLGCKPQRQKQNWPPVGLSLKHGLLMAINQSRFLCTWQLHVAQALLHSEPGMPSCLLFGSHGPETLWDTLR